jgi:type I restriction enzyme R subunit
MTKLTESNIEEFAVELFEQLGYKYFYGPDIAPDGEMMLRESLEEVVLKDALRSAVYRINGELPKEVCDEAVNQVLRIASPDVLANNEVFHRMMTEGVVVSVHRDGAERGELVWLVDFENVENNDFAVINQYTIVENGKNKRPDVILFVNGLPLVVIELKNAADENATIQSAFRQIETYKDAIPSLFTYNALVVISDGLEARAGSMSAGFSRMMAWKTSDG